MEQSNSTKGNGYRTLSIVLIIILALFVVGAYVYWKELDATQNEQQAQIDTLTQQIADDKSTLTTQLQAAQAEATKALNEKNAELQEKLDAASSDDSGTDSPDDSAE